MRTTIGRELREHLKTAVSVIMCSESNDASNTIVSGPYSIVLTPQDYTVLFVDRKTAKSYKVATGDGGLEYLCFDLYENKPPFTAYKSRTIKLSKLLFDLYA